MLQRGDVPSRSAARSSPRINRLTACCEGMSLGGVFLNVCVARGQQAVALHTLEVYRRGEEVPVRTIPRLCIGLAVSVAPLLSVVALAQDSYDYRRNVNFAAIKTFAFKATPPMEPVAEKTTTYDSPLVGE